MVFPSVDCEALYDAIKAKNNCTNDEWDEHKELSEMNLDDEYKDFLLSILDKAENSEPNRREREKGKAKGKNVIGASKSATVKIENPISRNNIVIRNHKGVDPGKVGSKGKNVEARNKVVFKIGDEDQSQPVEKKSRFIGCNLQAHWGRNAKSASIYDNSDAIQTRYDKSILMKDDDCDDLGGPRASDEFRKRVLEVLEKPYDQEEYTTHRKAFRSGNYFNHYPDLERLLIKHRDNRRKRLAILRGFFFWFQNVEQEGSFQPWKDEQCLRIEPPSLI